MCDAWFDPISLDEVMLHAFGSCMVPDAQMPSTGIRGECVDEPPRS